MVEFAALAIRKFVHKVRKYYGDAQDLNIGGSAFFYKSVEFHPPRNFERPYEI